MKVLRTDTPALFEAAVEEAARLLKLGGVVALPTETVYGLAANALDAAAVKKIFEIKGRPSHNPLIVHVAGVEMAKHCVTQWPPRAAELAALHWPGPLTLVLPKSEIIPGEVTANGPTVAIRWPSHPFMQAVIQRCNFPLAAPSANRSNHLSPTNAAHVINSLGDRLQLIIDGGQCQVGIESTVYDVLENRVLRPGIIPLGSSSSATSTSTLKSPGQLEKHYSPKARLIIVTWKSVTELHALTKSANVHPSQTRIIAHEKIPTDPTFAAVSIIPEDPEAYARALYAELHRCDEAGAELIIIERPPEGPMWDGIHDRLRRAAN
jgi:L-threonylcarbamoyladenylate synthase